jgi:hypothetical protein
MSAADAVVAQVKEAIGGDIDEVQVLARVKDAFAAHPERLPIFHMSEDEIIALGERLSFALRMAGLSGATLDEALNAAFREAVRAIERQRSIEWKRGKTIRQVQ